jgi:hypothetical protein
MVTIHAKSSLFVGMPSRFLSFDGATRRLPLLLPVESERLGNGLPDGNSLYELRPAAAMVPAASR